MGKKPSFIPNHVNHPLNHAFGCLKIGDNTVFQRSDGINVFVSFFSKVALLLPSIMRGSRIIASGFCVMQAEKRPLSGALYANFHNQLAASHLFALLHCHPTDLAIIQPKSSSR